ncbi:hypothetical protein HRbin15_01885 [bacterium HR15]|nr:hypothetical protein HRbin15_01885 [bacterium HR15]
MPRLSVWFIRLALIYFGLGFTLGAGLLMAKGSFLPLTIWRYRPLHIELLLIGWIVQLAIGVSYWILPRLSEANERGSKTPVRIALLALNGGVLTVCAGFLFEREWLVFAGRVLETGAVVSYTFHLHPRLMYSVWRKR